MGEIRKFYMRNTGSEFWKIDASEESYVSIFRYVSTRTTVLIHEAVLDRKAYKHSDVVQAELLHDPGAVPVDRIDA